MKQHITKPQWDELSEEQQLHYRKAVGWDDLRMTDGMLKDVCNIGQMISFLGNDWLSEFGMTISKNGRTAVFGNIPFNDKLCDALWEACIYKLNQTD